MNKRHMPARIAPRGYNRRRGYSLIEVLLAVGLFSVVMTAVAVTMNSMYTANRQLKDNAAYVQRVPRLALQFRRDVHAAAGVTVGESADGPAGIVLTWDVPGESIHYQSAAGSVRRTHYRDGEVIAREVYGVGKNTEVQWHLPEPPSTLVELELVRMVGRIAEAPDARQVDRVVAAIGLRPREMEGVADATAK